MLAIYLTLIDNEDDKKSFEDLYNQNRSKAYAIAFNILKNKTLAEEACSETFFSLAKSFQKIKNLESHKLDYYIVITVRNVSLNLLKKEKEHIKAMNLSEDIPELTDETLCDRNYDNIVDCIKRYFCSLVVQGIASVLVKISVGVIGAELLSSYVSEHSNLKICNAEIPSLLGLIMPPWYFSVSESSGSVFLLTCGQ